ncbi:hypothetical protein BGZ54_009536 [Gamsiella multidivaricata]|nr:hypothetical protein BGZ54_009536 [Gamsiella multidivaricata]
MTRIHTRLAFVAVALLPFVAAQGGDAPAPYDCERITVDGHAYNISAFKPTTFTIKGEPKDEHPSKIRVDYQLNPCSAPANDGQPARDVAPSVARADKIEDVKELPWNLTLKGGNINGQDQSAVITFICDMAVTDEKAGPTLIKYENGVVYFSWKSSVACPREIQLPTSEGMSGFGVFMTVLIVFGLIYLVLGAIYNRQVYGARGLDMLPNIGFWKDFPSLVVDVVRHVWDSVTGRHSSRGGAYVSV